MAGSVVLTLDGSTRLCSAALLAPRLMGGDAPRSGQTLRDGLVGAKKALDVSASSPPAWEVLASRQALEARSQAKGLLPMVDSMLAEAGLCASDLGAVVVGVGPGTFTGVRVAVATARALSLALSVPVVGVSTLAGLAAKAAVELGLKTGELDLLVPVIDAHRRQLFYALYEAVPNSHYQGSRRGGEASAGEDGQGSAPDWHVQRWNARVPAAVCDIGSLEGVLQGRALVVAEDEKLALGLPAKTRVEVMQVTAEYLVVGQTLLGPAAPVEVGESGAVRPAWGAGGLPEEVRPVYVRAPDADIHITKMRDPWAGPTG